VTEKVAIEIENPELLAGEEIIGERIGVGRPGDYKPCVAKLPDGELVLVAFFPGRPEAGKIREEILLYRSQDGGGTWSGPDNLTIRTGLLGREPYLTILADGTMLMTVHFLIQDVRNPSGYVRSFIHCSDDRGRTWTTVTAEPPDMTPGDVCCTTRNVLELPDGSLLMGLSARGHGRSFVWRSQDGGSTWPEKYPSEIEGLDESYPHAFFGEGHWWRARSGKTLLVQRLDGRYCVENFGDAPSLIEVANNDQYDRLVVYETTDEGHTLRPVRRLGDIGEMFPSILRLAAGRLLFTFTVRTRKEPLGVRVVPGEELADGFRFDCEHDRIMLDTKTPAGMVSGGGFGCTVQNDDGSLVTSYSYRAADDVTHMEVVRWRLP